MSEPDRPATRQVPAIGSPADAAADPLWAEVAAFLGRAETHGLAAPPTRIDTHAAAVFLAGPLAYKIKRPVRFPYLDFSTPARRAAACRREIAVDRPIAPEIYRRVVAITRAADGGLAIGGAGEAVEWAVEMNRFDEAATLDRRLAAGPLDTALVDQLAVVVADAEARAPVGDWRRWRADLAVWVGQNADAFAARPDLFAPDAVATLTRATLARLDDLAELLDERGRLGFVRLGHGDLHAANVAIVDERPLLFDAIEFDDRIATGDVLYDAGFLVMDLIRRGDRAAARRFLDRLLIETARREARPPRGRPVAAALLAEMDGLAALPTFLSIRAALRAKIAVATAASLVGEARAAGEAAARRLFAAAESHLDPCPSMLVAIGGLSGSGKSTLARALADDLGPAPGAVVLRSDEIRKLLAGVEDRTALDPAGYTATASDRVYDVLTAAAGRALAAGRSVIVDAVHLRPRERDHLAVLARGAEVPFLGLWLDVDPPIAADRVGLRSGDASDASPAVVAWQAAVDPGRLDWQRLDANGDATALVAAARRRLAAVVPSRSDSAPPRP
ncbi:hypothetical protein EYW49_12110 [Siculibacillus lacustris]|uniref:Aminoglycoside phosphotransferase domain-containing protein n=1 Tax=Siculibacillus lacustris TaxID=1549641 RepID=A0A4Q9VNH7_9HYPH|nr:AAA family ATPase [Siculibacillus lacustris]TBW37201.1 hypothetical protein EYW49_12110 [Siculibacillus lacustris]